MQYFEQVGRPYRTALRKGMHASMSFLVVGGTGTDWALLDVLIALSCFSYL